MGFNRPIRICEECHKAVDDLQFAQPHRRFCKACGKKRRSEQNKIYQKNKYQITK
jgi:anaerobic ribonucleoside-triphosphate reductase